MFHGDGTLVLQDEESSVGGQRQQLHDIIDGLNTPELYADKWLRRRILYSVYFSTIFKILKCDAHSTTTFLE